MKIGATATPQKMELGAEYRQHFAIPNVDGFAFAQGWAGAAHGPQGWQPDFGASVGVGFQW